MRLTRRNLFSAAAAAATAMAQPAAQQTPASKEQDLETARTLIRNNTQALGAVKVPVSTEPATVFKA